MREDLKAVADLVEWAAQHMADERMHARRYMLRPEVRNNLGEKLAVLSWSERSSRYGHRRESWEHWIHLSPALAKDLGRRWPVSERSGGRVALGATGVLKLIAGHGDLQRAELRAAEIRRLEEEERDRERELEREAERMLGESEARQWLFGRDSELRQSPTGLARESEGGLTAAFAKLAQLAPDQAPPLRAVDRRRQLAAQLAPVVGEKLLERGRAWTVVPFGITQPGYVVPKARRDLAAAGRPVDPDGYIWARDDYWGISRLDPATVRRPAAGEGAG